MDWRGCARFGTTPRTSQLGGINFVEMEKLFLDVLGK